MFEIELKSPPKECLRTLADAPEMAAADALEMNDPKSDIATVEAWPPEPEPSPFPSKVTSVNSRCNYLKTC